MHFAASPSPHAQPRVWFYPNTQLVSWLKKLIRSMIGHSKSIAPLGNWPEGGKPVTAGTDGNIRPGQACTVAQTPIHARSKLQ
jgi:hypothetical protein